MSTLTYYEPHKFSAGALALVVHAVFFYLLYFGVNWHVKTPPSMVAEMWSSLPDPTPEIAPVPAPPPPPPPIPVIPKAEVVPVHKTVEPVAPQKADIEFKDKKKKKIAPAKKEVPAEKAPPKPDEKARQLAKENQRIEAMKQEAREEARIQERKDKIRAEIDAAAESEKNSYIDLIRAKIRSKIITTTNVPENAEAIFIVTILPGGAVMDGVKLEKSSGNAAYDSAAERAIYKAQPLPMPQDEAVARMFRVIRLSIKP